MKKKARWLMLTMLVLALGLTGCGAKNKNESEPVENTVEEEGTNPSQEKNTFEVTQINPELTLYASAAMYVRNGPGKEFDVLHMLEVNEAVTAVGYVDSGWYCINYEGQLVYAEAEYLVTATVDVSGVTGKPENAESDNVDRETGYCEDLTIQLEEKAKEWGYTLSVDLYGRDCEEQLDAIAKAEEEISGMEGQLFSKGQNSDVSAVWERWVTRFSEEGLLQQKEGEATCAVWYNGSEYIFTMFVF